MNLILLSYVGSLLVFGWGAAHLFPTRAVVRGFGEISPDNRRIVAMEWIIEGVALIFIGILVGLVTYLDHSSPVSRAVYWLSFTMLNVLSLVSLFTGFRNALLVFKLCPFIFTGSSLLIAIGTFPG